MENKEINLKNISEELKMITDCLVDLKKETARVVIKQIYYSCFLNKVKLEELFENLEYVGQESDARFQKELNRDIASSSIDNVLALIDDEIKTAIDIDVALVMYLVSSKDIQIILKDDIPALLKISEMLDKMENKGADFPVGRICSILLNLIDETDLVDINFDELFEMMNDRLEIYIDNEEDFKKFIEVSK
jgi:hypothetical protein